MIEKDGNTAKNPPQKGCHLRAKAVLRTALFIEEKTNYDHQKRDGLSTLQPRLKGQSTQLIQCGVQKGFTVSYIQGTNRLLPKQQRFSSQNSTAYTTVYAKDSKPNSESHQELSTSVCRSYQKGIGCTIKGAFSNLENNQSRALCSNESPIKELILIELKVNSLKLFGINQFIGSDGFYLSLIRPFFYEKLSVKLSSDKNAPKT